MRLMRAYSLLKNHILENTYNKFYSTFKKNEYNRLMEMLRDKSLLNCTGKLVPALKVFKQKPLILYYFSASWCIPCRNLLPKIKQTYAKCHNKPNGFEIIYISMDKDEEVMIQYFKEKHGCAWYAIPFGDPAIQKLVSQFGVEGIPQLIVVKSDDGSIVTRTARRDIEDLGHGVLEKWNKKS